jgi:hypothetical protein
MGSARTVFMDAGTPPPVQPSAAAPPVAAAPPQVYQARLVLLRDDGTEGGVLVLDGGPENLGRDYGPPFDSDVYLDPQHVTITVTADGLMIGDKGSLNGLYIKLEGRSELLDGDQFRVGQELLRFEDLPEPEALPDGTERMGSPNPGYWGRLCVVVSPGRACAAYPIEGDGAAIGREVGDITFPQDGYVSGAHCRVFADDAGIFLEDLGSSNGTYQRVRDGQVVPFMSLILIGQQLFRLEPA